jgi:hypothetical protein
MKRTFTFDEIVKVAKSGKHGPAVEAGLLTGSAQEQVKMIRLLAEGARKGKPVGIIIPTRTDTVVFKEIVKQNPLMVFFYGRYRYPKNKDGKVIMRESMFGTALVIFKKRRFSKRLVEGIKYHDWS